MEGMSKTGICKTSGWEARLTDYLAGIARRPFAEGVHDCALFAAGAVAAMTGTDLAAEWRGRYPGTKAGLRALRRKGFADHVALVAAQFDEVPVAMAQPGDIAVVVENDGPALGIVQGAAIYLLAPQGLGHCNLMRASRAFRVI